MDSSQPGIKRGCFNKTSLQNPGGLTDNEEEEEHDKIKRRKLETHPLKIGNILEKIFSFLNAASIKNARQVNKLWSHEGAKMLINKCYLKIPEGLRTGETSSRLKASDDFKAFLSRKSVDVSMIPHITIEAADDVQLWKYFGIFGQLKSLKWSWEKGLPQLLSSHLDLMPNLTYLGLTDPFGYLQDFDTHIKSITEVMSTAAKDRKPLVMVISSTSFHPHNFENLEKIEKFADCNNIMSPNLFFGPISSEFNGIPELEARVVNITSKLVSNSQSVLKELSLFNCEMYLSSLEFPHMPALRQMTLEFRPQNAGYLQQCKFSPSFQFSEKIPNLHSVEIEYSGTIQGLSNDFFGNLFKSTGTAPSVKYLQYSDSNLRLNIDPLLQTFPGIKSFENRQTGCSETMFRSLWKFGKNLKKLDITIDAKDSNHKVGDLDSILTGFASGTVNKMMGLRKLVPKSLDKLQALRVNPSILDLKKLRDMTIYIDGIAMSHEEAEPFLPDRMLAVAGKYAFQYMPGTKISIDVFVPEGHFSDCAENALNEVSKLHNVTVRAGEFDEEEEEFSDYN